MSTAEHNNQSNDEPQAIPENVIGIVSVAQNLADRGGFGEEFRRELLTKPVTPGHGMDSADIMGAFQAAQAKPSQAKS